MRVVTILGQGVPAPIGTPTEGYGYEAGDPFAAFLPPPLTVTNEDADRLRALVIVRESAEKVGQEYIAPLLVLSGAEYVALPFQVLHDRICDALRGSRPRLIAEVFRGGDHQLILEDSSFCSDHERDGNDARRSDCCRHCASLAKNRAAQRHQARATGETVSPGALRILPEPLTSREKEVIEIPDYGVLCSCVQDKRVS